MAYPTDTGTAYTTKNNGDIIDASHVNNLQTEVAALKTKMGIDSSAVATTVDYKLTSTSSSNPGHKHTLANGATDVTATAAEVNKLAGLATTAAELGHVAGVTSAIQTQIDAKVAKSTLTTKGDLYVATGSATIVRQGVGTNNQVLIADSGQTNGIKWGDVPQALTKYVFAGDFALQTATVQDGTRYPVIRFADAADNIAQVSCEMPANTTSITSIKILYKRTSTGNLYIRFDSSIINPASLPFTVVSDTLTYATYAGSGSDSQIDALTVPSTAYDALTGLGGGKIINLFIDRDGANGSDTYNANWDVFAVQFVFA
jgi:hypothetical protein